MSTFALLTAGLAAFAPLASAYTTPVGDSPSGNAIYEPGLNSVVTAGKAFTITWEPTTNGSISLLLCKGPSTNCVITSTLADTIENSGSYSWTPSTDLAPSQPTGYGIELVVEGTGEYQYSTQFGLSNPSYEGSSSSSSAKSATATATTSSAAKSSTAVAAAVKVAVDDDSTSDSNTTSTASGISAASSAAVTGTAYSAVAANGTATSVRGTGVPLSGWSGYANATAIKPTGSMTVPSSLRTSTVTGSKTANGASTASGSASSSTPTTGAAAHIGASFGGLAIAAGIAVFAL